MFACVPPQRQQVSLLAQRLSGGPAVSEIQNHLLAGSGQVSGVSRGVDRGPLGAAWLGAQDPVRQELLWPVGLQFPGEVGTVERGQEGTREGTWHGICPQCFFLC